MIACAGLSTPTSFAAPSGATRRREAALDVEAEELARRKVAATCTCFLTPTATKTVTSTAVVTEGGAIPTTTTSTVAESACTSTSTVILPGARSCGVPVQSYTSGTGRVELQWPQALLMHCFVSRATTLEAQSLKDALKAAVFLKVVDELRHCQQVYPVGYFPSVRLSGLVGSALRSNDETENCKLKRTS
ncbi:hypothetical protein SNOG_12784 [Parastagonospora nodorum SN15]|uniref:Uncharacterized protein n=1 Tax=Phaeosphaeria nodorum (strain SN15 / ATCC MYA-4574 / FGSC 10173) TaxID=321614 RepID=Q0U630_PHANO|nr:hypothetical protein SNOG_12784 [Parastagonospora nodorum SN15]EAT80082.1 hypothetical protein SNOG_12784 [Parastagonospora nodorum SN15]